jgi:hypothetical protein
MIPSKEKEKGHMNAFILATNVFLYQLWLHACIHLFQMAVAN